MYISIITLFPEIIDALRLGGVTARAMERAIVTMQCINPRDFTNDPRRTVDDKPYGGGPGMLMTAPPLLKAFTAADEWLTAHAGPATIATSSVAKPRSPHHHRIALSPDGTLLTHADVMRLAKQPSLSLVCGRYEGIDERLLSEVDEVISIGDYVLSGGELPAMVLCDAIARQLPGTLGDAESAVQESFVNGLLDHPHYTRPATLAGQAVPAVLLNGNHADIKRWRLKQSLGKTWQRRPDLLEKRTLNDEEQRLLTEFIAENSHS